MLYNILVALNIYPSEQKQINQLMSEILIYLKGSFRSDLGYFSQGGIYSAQNGTWRPVTEPFFAADCQTWTISVLGAKMIDSWFGDGATIKIWETTKQLAGYNYNITSKEVDGIGFSEDKGKIFSGEWTFGAINALRVAATYYQGDTQNKLRDEADKMRNAIEKELTVTENINGKDCIAVLYANLRYYIPFGWWSNPVMSMSSTGWAVAIDKNYNLLNLGGSYNVENITIYK